MNKKMRLWNKLTLISLALILVLTACASNTKKEEASKAPPASVAPSPSEKAEEPEEAAKGGELTYALATSPDLLDPHVSRVAVSVRVLRTIYDSLVVQDADGSIKPWLATEWELAPDSKSYTFKLRKDVKFHDGTPFNAEAVKYNFDRILDPTTKAANAAALIRPYVSSDIIDEFTIKLNLATPSADFLGNLSQALVGIVSPTAAKKFGDQFGRNPVGSGPFKFVKWDDNAQINVERNPDYNWGPSNVDNKSAANLDTISFKIIPEEATRLGSVQSNQVQAAESIPPQNILSLKKEDKLQLLQVNTNGLPYTLFINQRKKPWNELKARQALQYGIDVTTIVQTLYLGTYEQAWSPISPGLLGYDKSLENGIKLDIDKANSLLDEIGWVKGKDGLREKDGKKLTLHYVDSSPNREKRNDIAAIVQQQLKKIGITVEVEITKDVLNSVFVKDGYDIFGNSQTNSDPNALFAFYHSLVKIVGGGNIPGVLDPELDDLLNKGAVEQDNTKRVEIYKQAQQLIINKAYIIPIYVFPYTVAASKTVTGLKFDALGYPLFNDVSITK
ncbi:ABC transporter substrate-binding protein [Cohnella abietis]|uniref:Peptide ABC transporter substrate-binding protein n=1 Tax=Cohnella abietis TaxID=2507935 RepID=A0A3T1DEX6_9BACL|nr:ABC transporter substrate-binding protein [Cohnella abietis]BBI36642.1 peptide ABC transporter substrate-binding protein [Cohnella abietis]